jgi:ribosomal protein L37E
MQEISEEQKNKIIKALSERGVVLPCPRCGNKNFNLVGGYVNSIIQTELTGGVVIGGPVIPSVIIVCDHCGFMSQHAIGKLGLLPKTENQNTEEVKK